MRSKVGSQALNLWAPEGKMPTSKVSLVAAIKSSIQGGDKLLSQRFQQADVRQKKRAKMTPTHVHSQREPQQVPAPQVSASR